MFSRFKSALKIGHDRGLRDVQLREPYSSLALSPPLKNAHRHAPSQRTLDFAAFHSWVPEGRCGLAKGEWYVMGTKVPGNFAICTGRQHRGARTANRNLKYRHGAEVYCFPLSVASCQRR